MKQAMDFDVISPNTVDIKSIEDYMYKICSALAQKMLVKLTIGLHISCIQNILIHLFNLFHAFFE